MLKARSRLLSWYLTKYAAKEVLVSFIAGTTIFLFILLMFQAIRLSDFVVIHQVGVRDVGNLCFDLISTFLPLSVPIAFLFAVLMGVSRANSEGELLALQANGISLGQIFLPVALFSVGVTAFCLYSAFYAGPQGNRAFELLYTRIASEKVIAALKPGVFADFHGLTLFAEEIIPIKSEMKRVFLYDERDEGYPLAITAEAGILRNSPEQGLLTLRLSNGAIHVDRKRMQKIQQKIDFDVYDINLSVNPGGDGWRDYSPQSYNYTQLKQRIAESVHDQPHHRQLEVEFHRRFSLSFSCIVFAALGFFIGTLSQRGVRSTAIIFCIAVALVYWLAYIGANALAMSGWVIPWVGIWAPNVLFLFVAYLCYRRYANR